jgi:Cu/Ag efflux protein CusF
MKLLRKLLTACALVLMGSHAIAASPSYIGLGVVKEIDENGQVFLIQHEAISGLMGAMTMPFELTRTALADGIRVGDRIQFTITQDGDDWPITALKKLPMAEKKIQKKKSKLLSPQASSMSPSAESNLSSSAKVP